MSIQSEVGMAVGRFADTVSAQAQSDPSAVGGVALSLVGAVGATGLAAWWRWRRNRERHSQRPSEARIPVVPGQDVNFTTTSRPPSA